MPVPCGSGGAGVQRGDEVSAGLWGGGAVLGRCPAGDAFSCSGLWPRGGGQSWAGRSRSGGSAAMGRRLSAAASWLGVLTRGAADQAQFRASSGRCPTAANLTKTAWPHRAAAWPPRAPGARRVALSPRRRASLAFGGAGSGVAGAVVSGCPVSWASRSARGSGASARRRLRSVRSRPSSARLVPRQPLLRRRMPLRPPLPPRLRSLRRPPLGPGCSLPRVAAALSGPGEVHCGRATPQGGAGPHL